MEWLKLHNDIRTDAKVRSMPMAERWIWVALLTYANEQPTRGVILDYDPDILALEIADGDTDILCNALQRYTKLRMIKVEVNTIVLLNFDKRQARKPSDEREAVKERVARHRARRKEDEDVTPVTPPVTPRNAMKRLERDIDKEEDKEIEVEGESNARATQSSFADLDAMFEALWTALPARNGRKAGPKDEVKTAFSKIAVKEWADVIDAARNYALWCSTADEFAVDPIRFVKGGKWRDFRQPIKVTPKGANNGPVPHKGAAAARRNLERAAETLGFMDELDKRRALGSG